MERLGFLLMAIVQFLFAVRLLRNPQAAKNYNVAARTIWARLPLAFYRGIGFVCAAATLWFIYLFVYPHSN